MAMVSPASAVPLAGPCAPARNEAQTRCADAERLAQAAVAHRQRLSDVRSELSEVIAVREADARVRDRRQLDAAKVDARATYRSAIARASDANDVREAARVWLREVDALNRQLA